MNKVYHGFSHSSGVYKITNKDNGLVYFGQAVQLATRAQQHENSLVKNKHSNYHLQAAWNHYGSDAFEFEVIAVYPDKTERDAAEQALIDENYGPGCYNIMKTVLPAAGTWSHTPEETSAKKSAAMSAAWVKRRAAGKKRKPFTPEHLAALSAALTGRKLSPEHRAAQTGRKLSAEHRAAMSAAAKRRAKQKI